MLSWKVQMIPLMKDHKNIKYKSIWESDKHTTQKNFAEGPYLIKTCLIKLE